VLKAIPSSTIFSMDWNVQSKTSSGPQGVGRFGEAYAEERWRSDPDCPRHHYTPWCIMPPKVGNGMTRTQIYLDEDQKAALRLLAAGRQSTVSDLVREAVDRLLAGELSRSDLASEMSAVQARLQARLGDRSEDDVAAALKRARETRRTHARQ
jgi:Arc/MetJ-type ribon-helix-helix transcriptional regulator